MRAEIAGFEFDDDPSRIDFDRVHAWLTTAYWSEGVSRERVEKAARHSASVVGAYSNGVQVGYCRVVSDETTFAWLCDVFVDESVRGKGIGKTMVKFALDLPYSKQIRKWLLATRDAHSIYAECGFVPLEYPDRWMWLSNPSVV